jgi:hypothetical protein
MESDVGIQSSRFGLPTTLRLIVALALGMFAFVGVLRTPTPAYADHHFAEISEVLVGFNGDPDIQFVEIQMEAGQNVIGNSKLAIFDDAGFVSSTVIPGPTLPSGADERYWIMGTAELDELVAPGAPVFVDRIVPANLPAVGGMLCWGKPIDEEDPDHYVDCLAYGTFTGTPTSPPKAPETPSNCYHSLTRTIPATFDGNAPPNDTWADGNNDLDFTLHPPTPTNNANTTAALPFADSDSDLAPDCIDPNTGVVDTDTDGCSDGEELRANPALGGDRVPTSVYDFFDVPTPAGPALGGDGKPVLIASSARNKVVSLQDVGVVLAYVGRIGSNPDYMADNNGDFIADGAQMDRTLSTTSGKPWRAGPPNNAVSLQDVGVALTQVGHSCFPAP